ncbi:LPXTG cell wall anchor domain-containing protein [Streptococcus suis]|uniref:LPXTG cell wall anchor domain-containing protein n=1 Tax=Streptococcus suis TaxID=1307 RepID=UPI00211BACFC|nr:LPXTG cell wall anchor domain-containing protein [Streptococcus suis]MCQ9225088.1 LPXTG cell wall anchor domain-containing protein [Streptococcus suis]MCQ9227360.1 LPXTG cell wall anchor domain-containing protein [Streptococcus suis]MCQ9241552.1 LPXTG cell wall anchor domain-containing protein [Streptococcus suis]MCQ9273655.1 LPXTG cell wall anchor domain-containing protein [Streptococcus suis]MDE7535716.1 LPXTG cell wall anchor domain-containing protein [Streptococcus suis]
MRRPKKVVESLAVTVAIGASATNLQVNAEEIVTPVAESAETVVTATTTTISAEQVEQAKEVASADAEAVKVQDAVDKAAGEAVANETKAVEGLTEAVAKASTAQDALPAAEAEVATQTKAVTDAQTAVEKAEEVVASQEGDVAKAQATADAAKTAEAQASAKLEEAKAQPVVTAKTANAQIAETKSTIATKEAEVAETTTAITATDAKLASAKEAVANYKPTTVTETVATTNYVELTGADRDMEDIVREQFPDLNPADYARQLETVIFDGEDTQTIVLTPEQAAEYKATGSFTYVYDAKAVAEEAAKVIAELRRINGITLKPWAGTQEDLELKVTDSFVAFTQKRAQELLTSYSHGSSLVDPVNGYEMSRVSESLGGGLFDMTSAGSNKKKVLSHAELAYNMILNWFSDYNNRTGANFGHRLHMLSASGNIAIGMATDEDAQYFVLLSDGNPRAVTYEQSDVNGKLTQTFNGNRLKYLPKRTFNYVVSTVVDDSQALKDAVAKLEAEKSALLTQQAQATETLNQAIISLASLEQAKTDVTLANTKRTVAIAEAQDAFDKASAAAKTATTNLQQVLASYEASLSSLSTAKGDVKVAQDKLATAQAKVTELKALLANQGQLLADLDAAKTRLEDAALAKSESSALLAELTAKAKASQTEADRLATLFALQEQFNTVITDDTVTATPKDAPTDNEKPALNIDDVIKETPKDEQTVSDLPVVKTDTDKELDLTVIGEEGNTDKEKTVVGPTVYKPQPGVTVQRTTSGEKVTYSRVERAHTLPNTGSEDNIVLMGIGVVLAGLGLAGARRRRHG